MSSSSVENMFAGQGDQFPVALRVLVVDDSITCQKILTKMLEVCGYKVTKCSSADVAVSLLKENKHEYDLVISDVHMPCMDGLKLLEHVRLETDLPLIMVSGDDSQDVVMKAVTGGACDYLIKPVRMDILKNIWQHVVRKKNEDSSSQKLRVIWTLDLHKKFIDVFNELGADKASAKKILTLMDVPGLTRENVSSHLQKYRRYLAEQQLQK